MRSIDLTPDLEAQALRRAKAIGLSLEGYVAQLIRQDEPWGELTLKEQVADSDPEFEEIRSAVAEGLQQGEQGLSRPVSVVFAELRAKYGIPG